jgi:hypothetical protein
MNVKKKRHTDKSMPLFLLMTPMVLHTDVTFFK